MESFCLGLDAFVWILLGFELGFCCCFGEGLSLFVLAFTPLTISVSLNCKTTFQISFNSCKHLQDAFQIELYFQGLL